MLLKYKQLDINNNNYDDILVLMSDNYYYPLEIFIYNCFVFINNNKLFSLFLFLNTFIFFLNLKGF